MKLPSLSFATVFSTVGVFLLFGPASANEKAEVLDAVKWAEPVMGKACDFSLLRAEDDLADSHYFEIRYRDKGQDQDSPDNVYPLYQLLCNRGAYNESFIYLTRGGDGYQLLSFARPKLDFDYADEYFTRLKAPPKVVGFTATTELVNPDFDPATKFISMHDKWRGRGDAWSSGAWEFVDGEFVLKEFSVDPTYDLDAPDAKEDDPARLENYQVYPTVMLRND